MSSTRIHRQEVVYPPPTEGGYKVCETGTIVNVGFPTAAKMTPINDGIGMMLSKMGTCKAWYDVGFRGEEGEEWRGMSMSKEKKQTVVKKVIWPNEGRGADIGEKLPAVCTGDKCMVNGPFGTCLEIENTKSCSYISFLENPVDRIIGLYNENCVNHGGDMILHTRDEGKKSCREMDILEFADIIGNAYVKEFASLYWNKLRRVECDLHMGGFYEQECEAFYRTSDFEAARAVLHMTKHVMVFPMSDMIGSLASLGYLIGGGQFNAKELGMSSLMRPYVAIDPNWKLKVDKPMRKKIAQILRHDVKLYSKAMDLYEKEYKSWKP
ncbi:hypothetical protein TrRE_jg53 [Triparma retinervis]|uniref:Uncharacterized protein n=1 Tax=Triparma retinervis TaxID=2557542 RepID=A0A9W7AB74_9STRA|nr:hypothetical protein TrRE_jg53 [Triparma retinervis]